jgi:hypothetical protein
MSRGSYRILLAALPPKGRRPALSSGYYGLYEKLDLNKDEATFKSLEGRYCRVYDEAHAFTFTRDEVITKMTELKRNGYPR